MAYATPTYPNFNGDAAQEQLFECILKNMYEGMQDAESDPVNAFYKSAERWTRCIHRYVVEGQSGIDLQNIKDYIGMLADENSPNQQYGDTNYLQETVNLTEATIILDSIVYGNRTDINQNIEDIENIYNILDQQDPIVTQLSGSINSINKIFTLPSPGRNTFGGREIEVYLRTSRLMQVEGTPIGRLFTVLDTGLDSGFNTVQLGFAPSPELKPNELIVRYYPIIT